MIAYPGPWGLHSGLQRSASGCRAPINPRLDPGDGRQTGLSESRSRTRFIHRQRIQFIGEPNTSPRQVGKRWCRRCRNACVVHLTLDVVQWRVRPSQEWAIDVAWVAPGAVRQRRKLLRYRVDQVWWTTRLKNRARAVLNRNRGSERCIGFISKNHSKK